MKLIALAVIVETIYYLISDYRSIGVQGRKPFTGRKRAIYLTSYIATIAVCLSALNLLSIGLIVFTLGGVYAVLKMDDMPNGITNKRFGQVFILSVLIIVQCIIVIGQ